MRTLYFECMAGASGDMILGALADLLSDPYDIKGLIESAGIPDVEVIVEDDNGKYKKHFIHALTLMLQQ